MNSHGRYVRNMQFAVKWKIWLLKELFKEVSGTVPAALATEDVVVDGGMGESHRMRRIDGIRAVAELAGEDHAAHESCLLR